MTPEEQIDSIILEVMDQAGQDCVTDIRQSINDAYPPASSPGSPPHLRTGDLHGGISYLLHQDGAIFILEIGSAAPYSVYLEYGTEHMAARPFMNPAQDRWEPIIIQRLSAAFTVQSAPTVGSTIAAS